DPFRGEPWATVARAGRADVDRAVLAAHDAFVDGPWTGLTAGRRGKLLHRLGDLVLDDLENLVRVESRDNGKSHSELAGSLRTMADWYHYYGGGARQTRGPVCAGATRG